MDFRDLVSEIKQKINLLEYVGRDVQLKRSGRSYRGRCPHPNHHDEHPSFVVGLNRRNQLVVSCFGCGVLNMDVINYVQFRDNCDFLTAIQKLSSELGISIVEGGNDKQPLDVQALLWDVMEIGREQLKHSQAAKDYLLKKRRLSKEVIEEAGIGFVADGYSLVNQLKNKGYLWKHLQSIGLVGDKYRCRFVNRILIPILNNGKIEAIAGRQISDDQRDDKKYTRYLYTQTPVSGTCVFTNDLKHGKAFLLVEGLMDLLSARALGVSSCGALISTAFAEREAVGSLLKRFEKVYVLLHEDEAGQRALEILLKRFPNQVIPVHLPIGCSDLNDALVQGRDAAWLRELLYQALQNHHKAVS
ncbi:CHC2 zinc finger domain-containing protein [Effusibacillus pohliae]|uniref:CHC2 zinc finger domain-containing protein n=1 Tax=Effusibacillus pohliae TaxID=232270 RepID=UPI0003793C57|nr:CHC2 zinc finger domain-containing protein [Effusibacillus pohliae]